MRKCGESVKKTFVGKRNPLKNVAISVNLDKLGIEKPLKSKHLKVARINTSTVGRLHKPEKSE